MVILGDQLLLLCSTNKKMLLLLLLLLLARKLQDYCDGIVFLKSSVFKTFSVPLKRKVTGGRYKTQVTGHRSQGTGHRSQVTEIQFKKLHSIRLLSLLMFIVICFISGYATTRHVCHRSCTPVLT